MRENGNPCSERLDTASALREEQTPAKRRIHLEWHWQAMEQDLQFLSDEERSALAILQERRRGHRTRWQELVQDSRTYDTRENAGYIA